MFFLVIRYDYSDAEQFRVVLKQEHRKFLRSLGKRLVTGGAIFDEFGAVTGGTMTFEAKDIDMARAIAQSDPYAQHPKIVFKTVIIPFRCRWKDGVFYDDEGYSTNEAD